MSSIKPVHFPKDFSHKPNSYKEESCKKKDQKILALVLQKIDLLEEGSGLLASACAPQVVLQNIFGIRSIQQNETLKKNYPMGIYSNDALSWLNACLQLIIFIPTFFQWSYFLPKLFNPLKDFIEKYVHNLTKQEAMDSISFRLIEHLNINLENPVFSFFNLLQESIPSPLQVPFFLEKPLEEIVGAKEEFFTHLETPSTNNHFFYTFQNQFYELTAFIEKRVNGNETDTYLAYLKVDGKWIQCDDHRVRPFSARNLKLALNGAVFCHYKKMKLTFQKILK